MAELASGMVEVAVPGGSADAYLTRPASGGPHPGALLFTDAFGIRAAVLAHAQRLAAAGYSVMVPNVFHRDGRAPVVAGIEERIRGEDRSALFAELKPKIQALTPAAQHEDAVAWLGFLRSRPEVATGPIGTVGYCMGGRLALRMAGELADDVAAAASFHGGNLATEQPDSPHHAAVHARGELYVGHADNDSSMPPEQMARLTQALAEAHVRHAAELYPGAAHGWTQTDTPMYDAASSERHWSRLLELFGRVL